MKIYFHHAIMILIAGMILILIGVVLNSQTKSVAHPIILSGLGVEFLGSIWLVLYLNQRRNRNKPL